MLFKLSDLEQLGGLESVCNVLAEDYVLGQKFMRGGFRVALSSYIVGAMSAHRSVRDFCARHVRWCQMRRRIAPALYFGEPLLSPLPFIPARAAVPAGRRPAGLRVADGAASLLRRRPFCSSWARTLTSCHGCAGNGCWVAELPCWLCKDLMLLGIWAVGAVKRTVVWRGNVLRIGRGSELSPAT